MSKTKSIAAAAAFVAVLGAAPQGDSAGVAVELNGATLLHRAPIAYPESARAKSMRGSVHVDITLDASGNVSDAHVVSGPEEFRRAVLQSVLQWHFAHETAGVHRQVAISFEPPAGSPPATSLVRESSFAAPASVAIMDAPFRQADVPHAARIINVVGLSDSLKTELLGKLSVQPGDTIDAAARDRITKAVREFDEHLLVLFPPAGPNGEIAVQIAVPNSKPQDAPSTPERIRVGGNVQQSQLIRQPRPVYPQQAKDIQLQGVVKFSAIIGKDGTVQQLDVIMGHPILVAPAMEAVRQWVYRPTLLNGNPVEVATQIDVNFTLSQ